MILTHSLIEVCVLDSLIRFSFNNGSLFGTLNVRVHCNLCCFCSLLSLVSSLHGLDLLAKTAKKHQHSLHGVALLRSDCEPEPEPVCLSLVL